MLVMLGQALSFMIYNESCADGCGILAFELQDWIDGLDRLFTDDAERVAMVRRAQTNHALRLVNSFKLYRLEPRLKTLGLEF